MMFFESGFVWFGLAAVVSFLVTVACDCVTSCSNCDKKILLISKKCPYCKVSREL